MPDSAPILLVEMPAGHREEREYALSVLLGEWLGLSYAAVVSPELGETRIRLASESDGVAVAIPDVLLAPSTEWLTPESLPRLPLPEVDLPDHTGGGSLPLLFAGSARPSALFRRAGDRIELGWDLLGSLVFMLTRYEEYVGIDQADIHDRFPSSAALMVRSGWYRHPVADMYLHAFAAILRQTWPGLDAKPSGYQGLLVGHDVDHPASPMLYHGAVRLRVLAGDLVKRRDPRLAARRASSFLPWTAPLAPHDPFNSFDFLMTESERTGVPSTFFFITADTATPYGSTFRVSDPWAARLLADIGRRGHFAALHGSYGSSCRAEQLAKEWRLLEDACKAIPPDRLRRSIRQHYLRWRPGDSWRAQSEAGLLEDETLAFADTVGYRAGTARSYPAFDLAASRRLPIRVRPLHVMDAALAAAGGGPSATEDAAEAAALEMRRRTGHYGGAFSILWHNSRLETPRARRHYSELLAALSAGS